MKRKILGVVLLYALLTPSILLASNITGAYYLTQIGINNTGTAAANVVANFTLNTTDMIAAGMLNGTATDAAMRDANGNDVPFMPGYNAAWFSFISAINAFSQTNQYLYTKNATGGALVYFPGTTGMNVTDNASLELGGNYSIEQKARIIAYSTGNNLANKPGAITWNTSGGNLTTHASVNSTLYLYPTANATVGGFTTVFGANSTQQATSSNDNSTSYIAMSNGAGFTDTNTFSSNGSAYTLNGTIAFVRLYYVVSTNSTGVPPTIYFQNIMQGVTSGTQVGATAGVWATYNETYLTDPSGGAWTWADIQNLGFGIYCAAPGNWEMRVSYLAVEVNYAQDQVITSTGVTDGEHTVKNTIANGNITNYIDGVRNGSVVLNGTGIVNTANAWNFGEGNATPYMYYTAITVNETLAANWTWQYGPTFNSNGAIATPTFRTTGTANISASVVAQSPTSVSQAPAANATAGWIMVGSNPTQPNNMYTSGAGSFPWKNLMDDFATSSGIPAAAIYRSVAMWTALLVGVGVFALTHNMKTGTRGSLLMQAVTTGAVMVFWYTASQGQALPGWVLIPVGVWIIILLLWRNPNTTPT